MFPSAQLDPLLPVRLHISDMETNSVLFEPSISNTVFPSSFSHSAAHSLSLQKASGLSSLPSVYPICDAVWATGLVMIGRRSTELPTRQKRSSQTARWNGRQIVSGLSQSARSGPADERLAVAALDMPRVPTPVNVWHALRVSSSVEIRGHKEVEDCVSITQQMHTPRELSAISVRTVPWSFLSSAPPFLSCTCVKASKSPEAR